MKKLFLLLALPCMVCACNSRSDKAPILKTYNNPVLDRDAPDPTAIRAQDGKFYVYTTERDGNTPVYESSDLVTWYYVGGIYPDGGRPNFVSGGGLWAPDINYVDGKYILYYSMSVWGGEWDCGIGCATSDSPTGPFTDHGKMFISKEIGVQNSIDPVLFVEDGRKYLAWGSFHGIYITELTEDGLSVADPTDLIQIAGTAYEGTYIHKRDGYYYLFASTGACCNGLNSTYKTVVGRSKSLFGPYVDKKGNQMLKNYHEVLLENSNKVVGPGHDSQIITDDAGQDWIFYHGYTTSDGGNGGRKLFLDKVYWVDGWPRIGTNGKPSDKMQIPTVNTKK